MQTISRGITAKDRKAIEEILRSTDYFYEFEIETALEIADATIAKGEEKSGYIWMKIVDDDGFIAFANYAKNDFSTHSWDLFWIAVHQNSRNKKLGSLLFKSSRR
ncbi:MAG: GNAT family N-acetyltransferase [Bacteroidetes bacterium]|nr:GNAT family N-acetyltransferase [Bacteroidota bacterium]